eukprot:3013822-Pyramimonas_sp.AAC.1
MRRRALGGEALTDVDVSRCCSFARTVGSYGMPRAPTAFFQSGCSSRLSASKGPMRRWALGGEALADVD